MLGGLLKPAWQSDSAEKRLQAVEKLDVHEAKNQIVFEQLVRADTDQHVRHAAVKKLANPELVFKLSQTHSDESTREQASDVLAGLISAQNKLSEGDCRQLLEKQPAMRSTIAQYCPHTDLRAELVTTLPAPEQAALLAGIEYTDTRQLIAAQLEDTADLELARKLLKGRDKSAEKIIKAKLDALHALQRRSQVNQLAAEEICEKVEYLAGHDWRPEFTAKFHVWQQRWQALIDNAVELPLEQAVIKRFSKANDSVAERVARHELIERSRKDQQRLAAELKVYCSEIASYSLSRLLAAKTEILDKRTSALERWADVVQQAPPPASLLKQFSIGEQALFAASNFCLALVVADDKTLTIAVQQRALSALDWPQQYPTLLAKTELEADLIEIKNQVIAEKKTATADLDKLHKRINRLLGVTNRGEISRANRELAAVTKAAKRYQGKDKIVLDDRLEKAALAVDKMGDWKDFATEPKFIELCTAMEALIGSKLHADKLAKQIHALQESWKSLGFAESADAHWPRFKEAADKAYQPCFEFFKQQRETRKQNLKKREPLIKQMQSLLRDTDWQGEDDNKPIDYKQVESELQSIANAWQKIKDVERGAGQKQWNRLSKIRADIYEKMDVVYDANLELKNKLLAQAVALSKTEMNEQSLGKLQLYQSKWKQVGITRRKQDQVVWRKFKAATDDVYEKIQGGRKAKRAEEDAQLSAYRDITKQVQQLAKSATELATSDASFDQLQADYKALPELPKSLPEKLIERLDADFRKAGEVYGKARDRILQEDQQKELDALHKKADLCTELEKLGGGGSADQVAKLQQSIAMIQINNNEFNRRFEQRLAVVNETDRSEANQQRRQLCIDLEILLGVDSPSEDTAIRMQLQLERMQQKGLGQAELQKDQAIEELKLDWLCLPGAEPKSQAELDQRFSKLLKNQK